MASANNPTSTDTTQQGARSRGQPDTNGGRSGGQPTESRSDERGAARAVGPARRARELTGAFNNPFDLVWQLSRDMDRMVSALTGPIFGANLRSFMQQHAGGHDLMSTAMWSPHLDVEHRNDAIVVRADLPGVRKEDLQIDVTDETLTIAGERRDERQEGSDQQGYRAVERSYGSFFRTVQLPQKINADKLTAKMRDGVLEITIPLDESARPRRIKIQD